MFISEKRKTFAASLQFCREIGGVMAVAEARSEGGLPVSEMISAVESRNCEQIFWTGWSDEAEEGEFVSAVSGEPLVWESWLPGRSLEDCRVHSNPPLQVNPITSTETRTV